jgi:hypothetical protein
MELSAARSVTVSSEQFFAGFNYFRFDSDAFLASLITSCKLIHFFFVLFT